MAVYGIGNILAKALGFLMLPFYTHYLGPRDYGILEIIDLSMTLFGLVLNMGLTPAFLRCYAAADSDQDKYKLVSTGCIFGVVTGALTFAIGVRFIRPATLLLLGPTVPSTYILLSFSALVLNYAATLPRTYLRALDRAGTYTVVDTAGIGALLCLNIVFVAFLHTGLAGVLWSSLIVASLQFITVSGWAYWKAGIRFDRAHLQRMLGFGIPLIFANMGLFILNFSDRWFLRHFWSLDVVGIYAVGYKFGFMMNYLFVQPFFVMWQSRMYAIHAQVEHPNIFRQIFAVYGLGLVYAGLAMSIFSPEVVRLMVGRKFVSSQEVIPIVVASYIFYGLSYYAQLGLFLTDKTRVIGVIGGVAAVLNLVFNYFLIGHYGMMGAAWSTLLSFAFITAVSYWQSQRAFRLPLGMGRVLIAMALAVGVYLLCRFWSPSSLWLTLAMKSSALVVFPILVWKAGILPPSAAATLLAARTEALARISRLGRIAYGRSVR
jgi:O-antigen/teichoic acid export membrane protein